MNINDLKPAWQQHKIFHSLTPIDKIDILHIIEPKEELALEKVRRLFTNYAMFALLMICCQGG